MTNEKLTEILDLYEDTARRIMNRRREADIWSGLEREVATKILDMVPRSREFLKEDRREKLMRWLGFMQGAWWASGVFSVEDLKKHNMPPDATFSMNA